MITQVEQERPLGAFPGLLLGGLTCMALALAVPAVTGDGVQSSFEADPEGSAIVLALFGAPIVVGLVGARRSPVLAGIAAGAGLLFAAIMSFSWTFTIALLEEFDGGQSVGGGLVLMVVGSLLLLAGAFASMRMRSVGAAPGRSRSPIAVLGAIAGIATTVGLAIPTDGTTVDQWLGFEFSPLFGMGAMFVLGSFAFVSIAGFLGGRWGGGLVVGFVGVLGVAALITDEYDDDALAELVQAGSQFHDLAKVGFWATAVLMAIHLVTLLANQSSTPDLADAGAPAAQWTTDPFGRYRQRYWDGRAWTQFVSDGSETMSDPPVPGPTPAAAAPPAPSDLRPAPPVDPLPSPFAAGPSLAAPFAGVPLASTSMPASPLADERTLARSELAAMRRGEVPSAMAPVVAAPVHEHSSVIRFDSGEELRLVAVTVIGRDPSPAATTGGVAAHAIADHTMSVSKSHVALGPQADGVWVEDLGSVNGTVVVTEGGFETSVAPGQRLPILPGTTVRFGERWCKVV